VDWDSRYRAGAASSEPHPLVIDIAKMVPPGRALDLACGAGRNARYLAERGWNVTAIDMSIEALRLVGLPRIVAADLERSSIPIRDVLFDAIIVINFLHRPLFTDALRLLRPDGAIGVAILTSGRFSLPQNELRHSFEGCRIAFEREGQIVAIKR
jgi:tellurite methyltransferase